jgi:DNA polymerase-3 subunit alpha
VRPHLQADPGGAEQALSLAEAREQEPQINELMADGNDGESIQEL